MSRAAPYLYTGSTLILNQVAAIYLKGKDYLLDKIFILFKNCFSLQSYGYGTNDIIYHWHGENAVTIDENVHLAHFTIGDQSHVERTISLSTGIYNSWKLLFKICFWFLSIFVQHIFVSKHFSESTVRFRFRQLFTVDGLFYTEAEHRLLSDSNLLSILSVSKCLKIIRFSCFGFLVNEKSLKRKLRRWNQLGSFLQIFKNFLGL